MLAGQGLTQVLMQGTKFGVPRVEDSCEQHWRISVSSQAGLCIHCTHSQDTLLNLPQATLYRSASGCASLVGSFRMAAIAIMKPTAEPRTQNSIIGVNDVSKWSSTILLGMNSICSAYMPKAAQTTFT